MFTRWQRQRPNSRRKNQFLPGSESLEGRVVMSWAGTPPPSVNVLDAASDRFTITSFGSDGNFSSSNAITRNEVDYRTFVAQRSGTYTFEALANNSRIDTVAAVFSRDGARLAYNDDAGPGTHNSKFTVQLQAGTTYVFGVTNLNRTPTGAYTVKITAPGSFANANVSRGSISTYGSASLQGTNLQLYLAGTNRSNFNVSDHSIEVQLLDLNGRPVHTGSWVRGFRTAGTFVPGNPSAKSDTWNINLSGWDLSRVSRIWVRVSQT
jgi:hypothetical protein